MVLDRWTAATIIIGAVLFLIAAFAPVSRVFAIPDAERKLEIITSARLQWTVAQVLFGLGAVVTVTGIAMLAHRSVGSTSAFLYASAALMALGALSWIWHLYLRTTDPARFAVGAVPVSLFAAYALLTLAGLALLGFALLGAGLEPLVGWLTIGAAVLFLVVAIIIRDLPPLLFYIVTLVVGFVLYRASAGPTGAG
jgi:hypothetical protein